MRIKPVTCKLTLSWIAAFIRVGKALPEEIIYPEMMPEPLYKELVLISGRKVSGGGLRLVPGSSYRARGF